MKDLSNGNRAWITGKPEIIASCVGGELEVGDEVSISLNDENHKFGWLQGLRNFLKGKTS